MERCPQSAYTLVMGKYLPSELGRRLKAARERAGLSQEELADLSQVNKITIARLETGFTQSANTQVATRLASALGVQPAELLGLQQSSSTVILVEKYLSSPWAAVDRPTPDEVSWLKSVPAVVWVGFAPTDRTVHEVLELHRKR